MSYQSRADLGGQDGHGAVIAEADKATFHSRWESRALALTLAMGATGAWNIDISRSARETLPDYATLTYYEIWLAGLLRLLQQRGLVAADEIDAGRMLHPPLLLPRRLAATAVAKALATGAPTLRPTTEVAAFAVGQKVRTRAVGVPHHTRLPGYARGKLGVIERLHGMHVFADAHGQGQGEQPQWLYTVVFDAAELWGEQATPGLSVAIDAWQPFLEESD
jgi:nitrile hydratase